MNPSKRPWAAAIHPGVGRPRLTDPGLASRYWVDKKGHRAPPSTQGRAREARLAWLPTTLEPEPWTPERLASLEAALRDHIFRQKEAQWLAQYGKTAAGPTSEQMTDAIAALNATYVVGNPAYRQAAAELAEEDWAAVGRQLQPQRAGMECRIALAERYANKGPWTEEEGRRLEAAAAKHGGVRWDLVARVRTRDRLFLTRLYVSTRYNNTSESLMDPILFLICNLFVWVF